MILLTSFLLPYFFAGSTFAFVYTSPHKQLKSTHQQRRTVVYNDEFGVANIPGVDWQRNDKVNQDAWFYEKNITIPSSDYSSQHLYSVVGVLDGHGKFGHEVSTFFADNLPNEVRRQLRSPTPAVELEVRLKELANFECSTQCQCTNMQQQALVDAFHTVHWNAMVDPTLKTGRNGATCIMCLFNTNSGECHVAYLGDSRGIRFNNASNVVEVIASETTIDTGTEKQRVDDSEGHIRGKNVFYGPVGIAMTRALGDAVMIRAGVVPTPLVHSIQLVKDDFIVLATDGVWDVLSNDAVRDVVLQYEGNAQEAADAIAKMAREKWVGDLPIMDKEKADDITVAVIRW